MELYICVQAASLSSFQEKSLERRPLLFFMSDMIYIERMTPKCVQLFVTLFEYAVCLLHEAAPSMPDLIVYAETVYAHAV